MINKHRELANNDSFCNCLFKTTFPTTEQHNAPCGAGHIDQVFKKLNQSLAAGKKAGKEKRHNFNLNATVSEQRGKPAAQ